MMRRLVFSALALLALSGCKTDSINPLKIEAPEYRASIVRFLESVLDRVR
jgi:Prokaryotic membrane lipoprotein lipid attachment site